MNELEKKSMVVTARSIDDIDYDITKEHVLKAIDEIESKSNLVYANTKWYVEINEKKYSARLIMQYAKIQSGSKLRWRRRDGPDTNHFLEKLGFKIIEMNSKYDKPKTTHSLKRTIPTTMTTNQPYNQILFGPPGTGKTFNTVNKALEILGENIEGKTRKEIKELFDAKMKDGQIVFTTFHQSMSYEDFIEGIKPIEPRFEGQQVIYKVIPGILKEICERIKNNEKLTSKSLPAADSINNFENLYSAFIKRLKEIISELEENETHSFESRRSKVKLIKIEDDSSILTTGETASSTETVTKDKLERIYNKFKSPDEITNLVKQLREVGTDIGWTTNYFAVFKALKEFEASVISNTDKSFSENKKQNYVLIIDEINRGNIAQIFGELITLIEDDKRLSRKEALEVTLPYSKEKFGVPLNLYIIGTMNTADRSVEALDTALRRRFYFEEMPSKPELLNPYNQLGLLWAEEWIEQDTDEYWDNWNKKQAAIFNLPGFILNESEYGRLSGQWKNDQLKEWFSIGNYEQIFKDSITESTDGIRLDKCLIILNKRIEKLLDKDHQIGHSYFMSVNSLNDLKSAFQHKIIPLLQEYFFGDYGKIGLVLGKGFFHEAEKSTENIFADFDYDASEFAERTILKLKNVMTMTDDAFRDAMANLVKK